MPEDAQGQPTSAIDLRWPGSETAFSYNPDTSQWTRSDLDDPIGFSFPNVIVLKLAVTYGGTDAAGTPIPTMQTTGTAVPRVRRCLSPVVIGLAARYCGQLPERAAESRPLGSTILWQPHR